MRTVVKGWCIEVVFMFAWYDFWVGLYFDRTKRHLYLFPLPMLGARVTVARNVSPVTITQTSAPTRHMRLSNTGASPMPEIGADFCLPGDSYGWDRVRERVCFSPRDKGWIIRGHLVPDHPYVLHSHIVNNAPQWDASEPETTT